MNVKYGLDQLQGILINHQFTKITIVTSKAFAEKVPWALSEVQQIHPCEIIYLPDGEQAKEWSELEYLIDQYISHDLDKKSLIIALGGGTVGDIVGLSASIFLRGVPYIQIPTTLLAQVDSAHGGKTAINFKKYKNLVGSTYDPLATIIEQRFINHLSNPQIIDGLGEIIKYGLIKDLEILSLLEHKTLKDIKDLEFLRILIPQCIAVKDFYTDQDKYDKGIRQMLNFGHTIAHAIELPYGLSHGFAVLVGMKKELEIGEHLGFTDPSVRLKLLQLANHLGIDISQEYSIDWQNVLHDKKIMGDSISLPVVKTVGESELKMVTLDSIKKLV